MHQTRTNFYGVGLTLTGAALLAVAALASNGVYEQASASAPARSLAWGPTLFRVLLAAHGLALVLTGLTWQKRARNEHTSMGARSGRAVAETKTSRWPWLALAALSIIALALRLWRLDTDLWYDELISLLNFFRPPLGEIVTSFPSQNQHMLYSVLAHVSVSAFGESAWAVRLPSVLFGVGSLWALFLLGQRLTGVREALLTCALMTVSYHHIWFSQNARGYMALAFFATLATWLWLEATEWGAWRWWVAYAAAGALGMWAHMTMAFVLAAHALIWLVIAVRQLAAGKGRSADLLKPVAAWALCGTLALQLHALALPEFLRTALHQESLPAEWSSPLWVIAESLRGLQLGFSSIAVVCCGGAMFVAGWLSITRRDAQAGAGLVLPAVLGGATMLALGHYLWPRFFFFSIGFALLIAVRGAFALPRLLFSQWPAWRTRTYLPASAGALLVGLMIAASILTLPRLYALPKQDYTGARDYVEQRRAPGDAVVAVGMAGVAYGRYFAPQWSSAQTPEELDGVRSGHSRVWLIYTMPVQVKAYFPEIWRTVERDFETVKVFQGTLGGGGIYVCRQRAPFTAGLESVRTASRELPQHLDTSE